MAKYVVLADVNLNIKGSSIKCKKGEVIELDKKVAHDLRSYVRYKPAGRRPKKSAEE